MSLILTLRHREAFYVDGARWEILDLKCDRVDLRAPDGRVITVGKEAVEISPQVMLREGDQRGPYDCYLIFDAPRSIAILREGVAGR